MRPLASNVTDTALLFEGGGMRASYTAAVVATLLDAGIYIDYVAGISAGASHVVNYLARDADRARRSFVDIAADPQFGDLRTFVRGKGMFNAEYIYEHTSGPDELLPLDWSTFAANPARLRIGSFSATRGHEVYFTEDDVRTRENLMVRVRASATMPILMPPVTIGDETFVDGALGPAGGIPLDVARRDGFTKYFVVMTRARDYRKKRERNGGLYRAHFRRYPAVAEAILARPYNYNRTREELFGLERTGRAYLFVPEEMGVGNGERRVPRLAANFERGLAQSTRELPAWREFLGV